MEDDKNISKIDISSEESNQQIIDNKELGFWEALIG